VCAICLRSNELIASAYCVATAVRNTIITAAIHNAVCMEMQSKSKYLLPICFFASMMLFMIPGLLLAFAVMFDWAPFVHNIFYNVALFNILLFLSTLMVWRRRMLTQRKVDGDASFNVSEYTCMAMLVPLIVYNISTLIWSVSNGSVIWPHRNEVTLLYYLGQAFLFAAAITILPGRVIRIIAISKSKSLSLKRIFVRYVSHEIRSPLNVVHAGLDILRSELGCLESVHGVISQISDSTAELIEDIYTASETAIAILNDLLHYEHMDAGTFQLEQIMKPLSGILEGKLNWATILTKKKKINLAILDFTVATNSEFSPSNKVDDVKLLPYNNILLDRDLEAAIENDTEENRMNSIKVPSVVNETVGISQKDVYLHLDMYKIDQVMRNLITNAVKFTHAEGHIEVKMTCELINSANLNSIVSRVGVDAVGVFRVEVSDTGAGIALEDQPKVFGEFVQFNRNTLQGGGGSGLGLWITRRIIHMHKGKMGFTSAGIGLGSTFFFELPLYPRGMASFSKDCVDQDITRQIMAPVDSSGVSMDPQPIHSSSHTNPQLEMPVNHLLSSHGSVDDIPMISLRSSSKHDSWMGIRVAPETRQLRFLVVDDSDLSRKMIVRLLQSDKSEIMANVIIREADDGYTALELMRAEMSAGYIFDAILMDSIMIRMHGDETTSIIRQELKYQGVIIGVTGNVLPEDIAKFVASGANEVITKPLNRSKLRTALATYFK